ncbi:hypothetical protein ACA910_020888 [Epithemia clementina (nom. ined.)]
MEEKQTATVVGHKIDNTNTNKPLQEGMGTKRPCSSYIPNTILDGFSNSHEQHVGECKKRRRQLSPCSWSFAQDEHKQQRKVIIDERRNQYYNYEPCLERTEQERIDCWYSDLDYHQMAVSLHETVQQLSALQFMGAADDNDKNHRHEAAANTSSEACSAFCCWTFSSIIQSLLEKASQVSDRYEVEDVNRILTSRMRRQLVLLYTSLGNIDCIGLEAYLVKPFRIDSKARRCLLQAIVTHLQQQQEQDMTQSQPEKDDDDEDKNNHGGMNNQNHDACAGYTTTPTNRQLLESRLRDFCNEISQAHCLHAQLLAAAQCYA